MQSPDSPRSAGSRKALTVGIVFIAVGCLLLTTSYFLTRKTLHLKHVGLHTQGIVVLLERSGSEHYPVFRFKDAKGRSFEIRSSVSSVSYSPGDKLTVVYDPDQPLSAQIDDAMSMYFGPVFIALFGSVFLMVGCVVYWFRNRFNADGEWKFARGVRGTPNGGVGTREQ